MGIDPREGNLFTEKLFEKLDKQFVKQYGDKGKQWLSIQEDIDPEDMIWQYVAEAFVVAFDSGYSQARQDDQEAYDIISQQFGTQEQDDHD